MVPWPKRNSVRRRRKFRTMDVLPLGYLLHEARSQHGANARGTYHTHILKFLQFGFFCLFEFERSPTMNSISMSFQSPQHACHLNPFLCEPLTPQNVRVMKVLPRQLVGNGLDLGPPSLLATPRNIITLSPGAGRSSEFKEALKRMRNGSALQRLKQQHDLDGTRKEEATSTCEPHEKGVSTPIVQLGRQTPERRVSGLARSA
jgi:hypothetical protein